MITALHNPPPYTTPSCPEVYGVGKMKAHLSAVDKFRTLVNNAFAASIQAKIQTAAADVAAAQWEVKERRATTSRMSGDGRGA